MCSRLKVQNLWSQDKNISEMEKLNACKPWLTRLKVQNLWSQDKNISKMEKLHACKPWLTKETTDVLVIIYHSTYLVKS